MNDMETTRTPWTRVLLMIPMALFVGLMYTFLHEGGHALFGLLFGGTLTSFSVNFFNFSAHAGIDGDFSTAQRAIISAAGISLPLTVWAVWMGLVPRRANPLLDSLKILTSIGTINTLLAWIFIPFFYLAGRAPGDDSTNFLRLTGIPPLLLSALALLVYIGGWAWMLARIDDWRNIIPRLRAGFGDLQAPGAVRTLVAMGVVSGVVLAALAGTSLLISQSNSTWAPAGYTPVLDVDLAHSSFTAAPVYDFTLIEPGQVSLYFVINDIRSGPLKLELSGPGDDHPTFAQFFDREVSIGRATVHPQDLELVPGDYQVLLTAPENPGSIQLFVNGVPGAGE
jgi:hypothetical protein